MNIIVNVKQLGKRKNKISGVDFYLENQPKTLRQLIIEAVKTCVKQYNLRVDNEENAKPITQQQIEDRAELGKIAFGINYNGKKADLQKAIDTAILGFEDGLFKVFVGEDDIESLDEEIEITENADVTFIKMTMLSGAIWFAR